MAAEIATQAVEINNIARDLGGLVQEQGQTINKVEAHVDAAGIKIEKAVEDVIKAASYQSSYRKKWICVCILLLLLLTALVVPAIMHLYPSQKR